MDMRVDVVMPHNDRCAHLHPGTHPINVNIAPRFKGARCIEVPVTGSPQVVEHKMDKYPSVTLALVIGGVLTEVDAEVRYIDKNNVSVAWNGGYNEGTIYIM